MEDLLNRRIEGGKDTFAGKDIIRPGKMLDTIPTYLLTNPEPNEFDLIFGE